MVGTVLVVDDEQVLTRQLSRSISAAGYQVLLAHNAVEARRCMAESYPDLVLMDLRLPDANGAELIAEFKGSYPETRFIIITAHGSIRSAVESTKQGVLDYLVKPFEMEEMLLSVNNAMQGRVLTEEVRHLRSKTAGASGSGQQFLATSRAAPMVDVLMLANRAARQSGVLLLTGESGTGKNRLAQWVHNESPRSDGPYLIVNCAALHKGLAESELFGHEPGAFTGSKGRRRGLLELATSGTLVLDEIAEMEAPLQSKLLTVLDTRSFLRVGGEKAISVDTRIIACTNQDLKARVEDGRFREDLYYRLNVFPIRVPPLRERREDIPRLVRDLLVDLTVEMGLKEPPQIDPDAVAALAEAHWSGNVRELRNVLERAVMLSDGSRISRAEIMIEAASREWHVAVTFPKERNLHDATSDVARELIREALRRGKTKQEAAKLLGISRHALAHQMQSLGVEK